MKTNKEIENMRKFILYFNNYDFTNKTYRKGILDAFDYVLEYSQTLDKYKEQLKVVFKNE